MSGNGNPKTVQSNKLFPAGPVPVTGAPILTDDELLQEIIRFLDGVNIGLDPGTLQTLDNQDASTSDIDKIKYKLKEEVTARLIGRANSAAMCGNIKPGDIRGFTDAVMRLGMLPSKMYILSLALFTLSPALEPLAAKSFARAIMARVLAEQMNFKQKFVEQAEIGALFMEIGKVPILLYQEATGARITEEFILRNYGKLGSIVLEKCGMSGTFLETIMEDCLSFYEKTFSVKAVMDIARMIVEDSFTRYRKLVIESSLATVQLGNTIGQFIADQFTAVGFRNYLSIRKPEDGD